MNIKTYKYNEKDFFLILFIRFYVVQHVEKEAGV